MFETTGRVETVPAPDSRSPEQKELEALRQQLNQALLVYSPENPKVKLLQRRIEQLEAAVAAALPPGDAGDLAPTPADPAKAMLDLQLAEIDSRIDALAEQRRTDQAQLDTISDSIARTPANAIALDAMQRDYDNLQAQYNTAVERLAQASTGERIALLARGEKVTVIEQPSVPTDPSKPDRKKLVALGLLLGIAAGGGLIVLIEMLNGTARRPADLAARLGLAPIAAIPYLQTRRQAAFSRGLQVSLVVVVLAAIPAGLAAVHYYYLPLDLLADRIMSRFGLRG